MADDDDGHISETVSSRQHLKLFFTSAAITVASGLILTAIWVTIFYLVQKLRRWQRRKVRERRTVERVFPQLVEMSYVGMSSGRFEAGECCLCFRELQLGMTVTVLRCNHVYCPDCIRDWIRKSTRLTSAPNCPLCREPIP